jgi:hypothetical protein
VPDRDGGPGSFRAGTDNVPGQDESGNWQPQVVLREVGDALQAAGCIVGEVAEERRSRGRVALDESSRVFLEGKETA